MKRMKQISALLLALFLVLSLSITAFATSSDTPQGSITVDKPVSGQAYTAYKIFDVAYDTKTVDGKTVAGDHYAYTIKNDSDWYSTVKAYAEDKDSNNNLKNGLALTASASDSTVYVVETTDAFSAPAFAAALKTALGKMVDKAKPTGTQLTRTGETGPVSATDLELGYYLVLGAKDGTTEALANLTTTNPSVTIHDKNDHPFDKVDDQESVDVGQTVNYTITGKVPDTTGFTSYTYKVTDMMTKGLTPNLTVGTDGKIETGVTIKVDNDGKNTDWTIEPIYGLYDTNGNPTTKDSSNADVTKDTTNATVVGFTATIDLAPGGTAKYTVGQAITITCSAVVNENAVAKIEKNSATLTYSNDPTDATKTTPTTPDEETVYSAKIVIDKYEKNTANEADTSKKLAGAEFVLYKNVTTGEATTKQYYKWNDTDKKVEWVAEATASAIPTNATKKTTDDNGAASFDGIADGTYYLLETKAPAGYNLLTAPVSVTVNGANATAANQDALTQTVKVANNTGAELPTTGGMGTTLFYIIGGILVVGAAVLLIVRRRMNARK